MSGNLDGWNSHGGALLRILAQKDTNTQIGPQGILGFLVMGSVHNPKYKLVNGPVGGG